MPRASRATRVGLAVLLVPAGGWIAVCVIVLNTRWWGLPIGVVATVLATTALPAGALRCCFVGGWVAILALAVLGRPEGDWAIGSDWRGYTMLALGMFLLTYAVATIPRRATKPGNQPSPT